MKGIQTSGGEIIGILKKIKDADLADSHHASLDTATKQNIVTSEWKERQKSTAEGLRADCCCGSHLHNRWEMTWRTSTCCSSGSWEPAGALQRELACDLGVRRSRARPHRLRAVVSAAAARPRRAL